MVLVGAPLIFFLLLEAGLRVAGYGYPTAFFLPRDVNGQPSWVENREFACRFMPRSMVRNPRPFTLPRAKPPGTIRIFVLGESAALGIPSPPFGFSRLLRVLLKARFPDHQFEVINVSVVAINSHALLPIARECAERDGDLWVIYMGNNEVVGPFGAMGVLGGKAPPLPIIRASLALKQTRLGQLLAAMQGWLRRDTGPAGQWTGMQMWKETVPRDDPRIARIQSYFQQNLDDILEAGQGASVPVILSTVACNLRDCSPFGSAHRSDLTDAERAAWDKAFQAGTALETQGEFAEALTQFEAAAKLDERFAELQFRLATCLLAVGRREEARAHFTRAKDEDALQFRPDSRLNDAIRLAAAVRGTNHVHLLDAERLFASAAEGGVPGEDFFYEHVHLTPAGNYLLARATAEMAADVLTARGRLAATTNTAPWLSQAECEAKIGLTDFDRIQSFQQIRQMLGEPPFTSQSIHSNQLMRLRAEARRLRPSARPEEIRAAAVRVKAAAANDPEDVELLRVLAPLLEAADDSRGAEQVWREITRKLPHAAVPALNLAQLINQQGRSREAIPAFEQCLRLDPDKSEAHGDLGLLLLRQGQTDAAIEHLRALVRLQPHSEDGHLQLGKAYLQAGKTAAAVKELRRVLELAPNHAEALQLLNANAAR